MILTIQNLQDDSNHIVRKYIRGEDGEIHVWSNTWYGHHIIGKDCKFVNNA